jgi:hypothetical protein
MSNEPANAIMRLLKIIFIPIQRWSFPQGARYSSISFASSPLSMARTRICRTTARASRGESSSGGWWQRPQLVWNLFSPSELAVVCLDFWFELLCPLVAAPCAAANKQAVAMQKNRLAATVTSRRFIRMLQARAETGNDKLSQSSTRLHPWNEKCIAVRMLH